MTQPAENLSIGDASERERAASTFERNIVVMAGAGTGKTTLLVDRLVHLIARNPDPLKITDIVALTFTNKAAGEMKLRLRERLQSYLDTDLLTGPSDDGEKSTAAVRALIQRYQLSKDELNGRLREALRHIERADIGTIHSFAATLLRLYPLEAGIDPQFREDEGRQFDRLFEEQWDMWLNEELVPSNPRAGDWRLVLAKITLDQIKALSRSLCAETVDLARRTQSSGELPAELARWLSHLTSRAAALVARHPEDRQNEKLARAAEAVFEACRQSGEIAEDGLIEERALLLEKAIDAQLKGWPKNDVTEAQALARAARGLCQVDEKLACLLWRILSPFAQHFRRYFTYQGFVSFDGLLIGARNLVRDHPRVREELKRQYRAILIDEFQDTDPIQYEILLYLSERVGESATNWRDVRLAEGKLFVVGDPKQSIYAFRRADIEAYLEVMEKIVKAQNGADCRLTTNFRSHPEILRVVNEVSASLIQAQDGLQPPYIPIHPAPSTESAQDPLPRDARLPRVSLRMVVSEGRALDSENARRLEGESLARWLRDEVLGKAAISNANDEHVLAQPKDVAILFRKLSDIHDYLEPLRRRSIRYVVEGERHFYAAREIVDAVNLLRAIENPHDRLAFVGVLRSPLGGLSDKAIYDLHCRGLLDYRKADKLPRDIPPDAARQLYETLARLHEETKLMPVGDALHHIFSSLPVRLLASCTFHGEQAVANLDKLRRQAEDLGKEGLTTLKEAVRQLRRQVAEVKEEGESVLAEETVDAVRIMSIHKAKGLEFPIVVLAGCHAGTEARRARGGEALFDWSSNLTGLRVGRLWDLAGLYIAEKARLRADEEQKRVFYVGMTRPREHLILSCAPTVRRSSGSFLAMLQEALGVDVQTMGESTNLRTGAGNIELQLVRERLTAPGPATTDSKTRSEKHDWRPYVELWERRRRDFDTAIKTPMFITPTLLKRREEELAEATQSYRQPSFKRTPAAAIGVLAHRFLQTWDFACTGAAFMENLSSFIDHCLPYEEHDQRTFIRSELEKIFATFFGSPIYAELASARILGREVPLLMPWNGSIMEGVIDLIYERNGSLYLADYKTDRVNRSELASSLTAYRHQADIYSAAARQSLGRDVADFKLIYLRLGEAVSVSTLPEQGELFT